MPRILSIATLYPNAHTPRFGTFVARQMEALAAHEGWEVTVVNPIGVPPVAFGKYRPLAAAAVDGEENGVQVYRPRFTLIPGIGGRFNPGAIVRAVLPLAKRLHAETPFDLVDAQFFYPDGPAAARIAEKLGLPFSIKARGADISHWGQVPYSRAMMVEAAGKAAGLLAVSDALRKDVGRLIGPIKAVVVHYTGLDRSLFRPLDRDRSRRELSDQFDLAISPDHDLIACVGALIPRKGQQFVIRALTELPDKHCVFVGTGPDLEELEKLAEKLGVADRIDFLGSLDHRMLPVVLNAADAMVLPSASEGLANAWVEALACGTPLVITDAGGARELVRDPTAGRIVERNPSAIAEGIQQVIAAAYTPEEVAANAAQFSWEANAEALASYYESLLS